MRLPQHSSITRVTLGSATFGNVAGSVGQVTLSGAGTTLNVAGTLLLGGSGTGVMTLGANTALNVGSMFIGPGGVLTTAGGSILKQAGYDYDGLGRLWHERSFVNGAWSTRTT